MKQAPQQQLVMKQAVFLYKSNVTQQWILILDFKDQGEIKLPLEISWQDEEGHHNLMELENADTPDELICKMKRFQLEYDDFNSVLFEHIAFVQHGFVKTPDTIGFRFQ